MIRVILFWYESVMEIKILNTFVTVAESRSFSEAARKLHTVQPAISRQISDLEKEIGVTLFRRTTREVKITAAGESLLQDAHDILEREARAKDDARLAGQGKIGRLRIGYLGPACLSFIPMLVREYTGRYPGVRVSLHEMTVTQQLEALGGGRIDVCFSRPLGDAKGVDIQSVGMYVDSLFALLPSSHALCGAESLRLGRLRDENFVLFSRSEARGLYDHIVGACHGEGFVPDIRSQPRTMQTVITEVAAGLGVSIVPGCIRRLYTQGCVFISLQNQKTSIPLELHYLAEEPATTVESFVKMAIRAKKDIQQLVFDL